MMDVKTADKARARTVRAVGWILTGMALCIIAIVFSQLVVLADGSDIAVPYLWASRRVLLALFASFAALLVIAFLVLVVAYEALIHYWIAQDKKEGMSTQ